MVIKLDDYKRRNKFVMVNKEIAKDGSISPRDKAIYMALCSYMDNETKACFPSYKKLEEDTGLSNSTIKRGINSLIENKYISKSKRVDPKTKKQMSNVYLIL